MTDPSQLELVDDVRELVDDLGQWLQWAKLTGTDALPVDGPLSEAARAELLAKAPPRPQPSLGAPPQPSFQKPSPPAPSDPTTRQPSLGNWGKFVQNERPVPEVGALDRATSLQAVREELGDCQRCGLCRGRRNIVFGVGSENADLMVVGEGPGANEDRLGEPFVGNAGQMLDKMLENVLGLRRDQVYIANVVKCRPPGNRNPELEEVARCRPFLLAQMRVIKPKVVLVLGSVACRAMFEPDARITRLRGNWRPLAFPGGTARAMPTFHPAYLLRQPAEKRKTFEDLKAVKQMLAELSR